ncbi:hypothetical protein [Niabella terrae]
MRYLNFLKISLLVACFAGTLTAAAQSVNRKAIYDALSSGSTAVVDAQLGRLTESRTESRAFKGALLMRKAGLVAVPAKKLALFKQGYKLLESAIAAAPQNPEYRFLRLMIQEHAPRNLGYYKNTSEDSKKVIGGYDRLPTLVQKRVHIYSKQSKALPSSALKRES